LFNLQEKDMHIMARREQDDRAEWEKKPYYPAGDGYTWESFMEAQEGKTGPFALALERGPSQGELMYRSYPYYFIGLFADREDGKLGKLCIGQGMRDMEPDVAGFVYADGLDPGFLQTCDLKQGVLQRRPMNKVVSIRALGDELEMKFLWDFIRPDANYGMPLNKAAAVGALRLRDYLHELFQEWRSPRLAEIYYQLEFKLKERHGLLAVETARVRRQLSEIIQQNEKEMKLLLNKPL
jgi:hypothetical protein